MNLSNLQLSSPLGARVESAILFVLSMLSSDAKELVIVDIILEGEETIKIMNDEQARAVRKITRSLNKQQHQYRGTDVPPTTKMPPCAVTM